VPRCERERGVCNEMRSTVHINPVIAALEIGIRDLGKASVQRQPPCDRDRCLDFVPVGPAGSFELEAAIVGDVDLLIRVINQEPVRADAEPAEVRGGSGLIEICRREPCWSGR